MNQWQLWRRTVVFFWRSHAAVAAGVAVAAAVITGALLLGDSLRGSLRRMSLDRLGPVDAVLRTDRFFRATLADELQARLAQDPRHGQVGLTGFVPLLVLEGVVETADGRPSRTAGGVQVIGCDERFWQLESDKDSSSVLPRLSGSVFPEPNPAAGLDAAAQEEPVVLLNQPLAEQLGLEPGQEILIRFSERSAIAPESALGRKDRTVRSWRVRVAQVVPESRWTGRFAWTNFQQKPLLVYVPLAALQQRLNQPGRVNTILAIGQPDHAEPPEGQDALVADCLRPTAEDYGLRIERVEQGKYTYIHITTDHLLFPSALEETVRRALVGCRFQPILTYLANTIQLNPPQQPPITEQDPEGRIVPYSTITAIDFEPTEPFGPFRTVDGRVLPPLQDGPEPEIVLNVWAARSLGLTVPEPFPGTASRAETAPPETAVPKAVPPKTAAAETPGPKTPVSKTPGLETAVRETPDPASAASAVATPKLAGSEIADPETAALKTPGPETAADGKTLRSAAGVQTPSTALGPTEPGQKPIYIYVTFFEPETVEGQAVERTERFRLAGLLPMEGPVRDRHLTPEVPGLTDRRSMAQWEVPFHPFHEGLIRPADEEYFRREGLTPKAFVSLATGWRLWASRFGRISSFRVAPDPAATVENLRRRIQEAAEPARLGFQFQPVKRRALAASEGSSSFEMLFLGFSGFLILSAGMLVVLLFQLAIQTRQEQLGLLLALGFTGQRIGQLLLAEGMLAALVGSGVGTLAGWAYGAVLLAGFRAWAGDSLNIWFLRLEGRPASFLLGFSVGLLLGTGTIAWAVRRSAKAWPRHLLSHLPPEEAQEPIRSKAAGAEQRKRRWLLGGLLAAAAVLGLMGWTGSGADEMAQAGAFFGAGSFMLVAALVWLQGYFRPTGAEIPETAFTGRASLVRLAFRSAGRNPRRSSLTVGLMAAAVFLITSTSVFRVQLPGLRPRLEDGTGGFLLWAETTMPIFYDLGRPEGRARLESWSDENEQMFQKVGVQVFSLRVRSGDDASCQNLYRPSQPRILGLPDTLLDRPAFAWATILAQTAEEKANPWLLLNRPLEADPEGVQVVPAIVDADTATYSLKVGLGQDVEIRTDQGRPVRCRIVGLLRRSMFQGDLLIWQQHFVRLFPEVQGYRLFLTAVATDGLEQAGRLETIWHQSLREYGVRLQRCRERLAAFLAVQNTYLATFQSLGGLGLLLGTMGLGVVQMRNVLERRGELALLAAVGFPPARLGRLILWETWLLLALGLGCGALAAAVAVWPHWLTGQGGLPWTMLAGGLVLVMAVGSLAGLAAVRTALRLPLLEVLRRES